MTPAPNAAGYYSCGRCFVVTCLGFGWVENLTSSASGKRLSQRSKRLAAKLSLPRTWMTAKSPNSHAAHPILAGWLGDKAVAQLILPFEYTDEKDLTQRMASLFPEVVLTEVWWTESHAPTKP